MTPLRQMRKLRGSEGSLNPPWKAETWQPLDLIKSVPDPKASILMSLPGFSRHSSQVTKRHPSKLPSLHCHMNRDWP